VDVRPAVVLVATIAVAAAAGTAVSLTQRPHSPTHQTSRTPIAALTPPPDQPAVAFGFSIAADLATQRVVLFGGVGDFGATWLWDGAAWARVHPDASPTGRYGASSAFDPGTGEVMLFGGTLQTGQNAHDTWAWEGRTWQELDAGTGGPAGGEGSVMVWDNARGEMVLVTPPPGGRGGGTTWIWNGAHWVRDRAGDLGTTFQGILIAFDRVSDSLMAEGCCQPPSGGAAAVPGTWRWNGSAWIPQATSVHPLDGTSMAEDPSISRLVLCGCDLAGGQRPELWVWNGHDWMVAPYPPPPVAAEAEVIDPVDSQFLVLGSAISGLDTLIQTLEVWTLRGTHWRRLGVGTGPASPS
jgi:hypothetical protein